MFDLFRSREKNVRILLGVLLVLVAISMLTYLVPNYGAGQSGTDNAVIAQVGGQKITSAEVRKMVNDAMRGKQFPKELLPNMLPGMVDNMITERVLEYEAERVGIQVTDAQLSQSIQQLAPALFPDGKFVGREAYAAMLAQQNITIGEFEDQMRRTLLIERLRKIASEGVVVTPQEVEREYKKRNEKVKIEYAKLDKNKYKAEVTPSADEIEKRYKANTARYMVPESRNVAILEADRAKIEETINPTDADLQAAYNANKQQFFSQESSKVRHILLKTEGKSPAEDAAIKAKAEDILKQVKSGAKFADLVKKYSEDTGSVNTGGEYTVYKNGQMVPEFEAAAFRIKPGDAEVVKTTYGYHIVQVIQRDPARLKPFEEVKGELATNMKKQRAADIMDRIVQQAQQALEKDPANPDKVAADLGMRVVRVDNVQPGKAIGEFTNPDLDQAIQGLKVGQVTPVVGITPDKFVVAVVTGVTPPRQSTLAEVQNDIKDQIIEEKLRGAVESHAKELAAKAQSMGGDLAKAAKSMGIDVKTSAEFTRDANVEGFGMASYVSEAFDKPEGTVLGPIETPEGTTVVKVVSRIPADMAKLAEKRQEIYDDLKSQKANERKSLFEYALKQELTQKGKLKINKDEINRLITQMTGNS